MNRIAVGLEYDGTAYAGWQFQPALNTLQGCIQKALSTIAAEPITLVCAGRTDAGVHARGQVAHFETNAVRETRAWLLGANTELPPDISVTWVRPMPAHFHARYSAQSRTYRYLILNRLARSALVSRRVLWLHRELDHERMQEAARFLIGEHDFSALRAAECQARTPVRRLTELTVQREGDWVSVEATANAFLHHMMRNIVGLLLAIGQGKAPPEWAREVLESRDRSRSAATAPAWGLYLWSVQYPAAFDVPAPRSAIIPNLF